MKENFIAQLEHSSYYELSLYAMNSQKFVLFISSTFILRGSGMNGDERNCTE